MITRHPFLARLVAALLAVGTLVACGDGNDPTATTMADDMTSSTMADDMTSSTMADDMTSSTMADDMTSTTSG